ncbi:hypothetical protein [Streptomyces sp. NPDC097619]|uniref:hypothetical protein n=1 Tax=Streptomyces sp. NPDC097619 TaxID=3157228 RepID=UPI003329C6A6
MAHGRYLAALALCGALALTGCRNGEDGAQAPIGGPGAGTSAPAQPTAAGSPTAAPAGDTAGDTAGDAGGSGGGSGSASKPSKPAAPSKAPAPAPEKPGKQDPPDCDHKMPISPDEIAVYRYTPEGGFLSLIVKHGNWGCGTPDSDGAPFETVGKETFIPMDQAAAVTVTDPIVASTENQKIGVQEFLDWLEAHPNSGLVFRYHLGSDGAIDTLDQVFTP